MQGVIKFPCPCIHQPTYCLLSWSVQNRCAAEKYLCLKSAPSHLMLTVKRFNFDYRSNKSTKITDAVDFDPVISLPAPAQDLHKIIFDDNKEQIAKMKNLDYGLYAVIIHTGNKLDGGHYFTFARESESDLTVEEDVM